MDLISLFSIVLGNLTNILDNYLNTYFIIVFYASLYCLYYRFAMNRLFLELAKRKQIIQDIHLYKMTHPASQYPAAEDNNMKSVFHGKSPNYPESYYLALEQIIKKWNGRPLLALLLVFIQYMLFLALFAYCIQLESGMVFSTWLYLSGIGFLITLLWGKRLVWLKVIIIIVTCFSYRLLAPEALLFLLVTSALGTLQKIINWSKTKKIPS